MKYTKKYKLIIFDWDGTLMDSQSRIVSCLQSSQQQMDLPNRTEDEFKNIIGLGLNEAIQCLYPELNSAEVEHFADLYRQCYSKQSHAPLSLFEQVRELLFQLKQSGVMLAIATGKARRGLELALNEVNLQGFFHASRCADETLSKPHPQMLEELLAEFALAPQDAVMIGDTEYDLLMAKTINMDAVAVSYGVHERERLLSCQPLACMANVEELGVFLKNVANNYLD